jgi:hypothetical protein
MDALGLYNVNKRLQEDIPILVIFYGSLLYYCHSYLGGYNKENGLFGMLGLAVLGVLSAVWVWEISQLPIVSIYDLDIIYVVFSTLSYLIDCIKFGINLFSSEGNQLTYNSLMRYREVADWGCGSTYLQMHSIGMYSSFFFPVDTLQEVNQCCARHDFDYCCQIGIAVADQRFYSCVYDAVGKCNAPSNAGTRSMWMKAVHDFMCDWGHSTYVYLLDLWGSIAYENAVTAHDCVDVVCK